MHSNSLTQNTVNFKCTVYWIWKKCIVLPTAGLELTNTCLQVRCSIKSATRVAIKKLCSIVNWSCDKKVLKHWYKTLHVEILQVVLFLWNLTVLCNSLIVNFMKVKVKCCIMVWQLMVQSSQKEIYWIIVLIQMCRCNSKT